MFLRMNDLVLRLWKKVRWVPGFFYLSQWLYSSRFAKFPVLPIQRPTRPNRERKLCVISDRSALDSEKFQPLKGNYSFEIYRSARERYGDTSVLSWPLEELTENLDMFVDFVDENEISHLIICPESPESPETWGLPRILNELSSRVNVTLWFYLLDSVHWDHMFKLNQLRSVIGNYFALAIDRPIRRRLKSGGRACEPSCLPISSLSLNSIPESSQQHVPSLGFTFVGGLYGYRKKILSGIDSTVLRVNPHRGAGEDPSYENYLLALRDSTATVNFARASSYNIPQLKSRVLEAGVMGCPVISDDSGLGARFLKDSSLLFTVPRFRGVRRFLIDQSTVERLKRFDRQKLIERSRKLAPNAFWESFEKAEMDFFKP